MTIDRGSNILNINLTVWPIGGDSDHTSRRIITGICSMRHYVMWKHLSATSVMQSFMAMP
jgi:hypothetical protein